MRVAIIGGGISGLTAAYECEKLGLDWQLYEASDRLGGIVETKRLDGFVLEGGPDGWVSEKPWARELAVELGLADELIYSNDATRKTYVLLDGKLVAIPDGMRMMVPGDLSALEGSELFSAEAKRAYAAELTRAEELKASAPAQDESVASFVLRHFGNEVLEKVAAPLLGGVFGGDVYKLSVRAVMPQFVAMEREYGSLIAALQAKKAARGDKAAMPIFTSLRGGVGALVEALVKTLPAERIHLQCIVNEVEPDEDEWNLWFRSPHADKNNNDFAEHLIFATSLDATRGLLRTFDLLDELLRDNTGKFKPLLPTEASSAVLAAFTWTPELAQAFTVPEGFGFLVPPNDDPTQLLAATFVDQKYPDRVPEGGRILRAFFGGASAEALRESSDGAVAEAALGQLRSVLGPMPEPVHTVVNRWPRSLPQYEVGHLERMAELDFQLSRTKGMTLLGNAYRGVGLPDLIRDARAAVRRLV